MRTNSEHSSESFLVKDLLKDLFPENSEIKPKAFAPNAYFDKHMDCIRVEIRDCSITELRISEMITILIDNNPEENQQQFVGIMIKGIKHLFKTLDLPMSGIVRFTRIWDAIAKKFPEEVAKMADELHADANDLPPIKIANETEMMVEMAA